MDGAAGFLTHWLGRLPAAENAALFEAETKEEKRYGFAGTHAV